MSQTDELLVARCKRGDVSAFEQLIDKHQSRVFNLAYRMTGSEDDARDMAQEAFLKVYTSLASFRGKSSFSTWLYRIVSNACVDELRRRNRRPLLVIDRRDDADDARPRLEVPDSAPGPEEQVERREQAGEVQSALKALPEAQRLIIVLRDLEDFSYQEIAEIMSLPVGTVKSRLSRARHALRDELQRRELFRNSSVN